MSADVFAPLRATIARAEHCLTEHSANVYVGAVFELVEAKALLDRLLREHAERGEAIREWAESEEAVESVPSDRMNNVVWSALTTATERLARAKGQLLTIHRATP